MGSNKGTHTMRQAMMASLLALLLGAPGAWAADPAPQRLGVLEAARTIELDMSAADATAALDAAGFSIEIETDLPPDGLNRLLVAMPTDDDCIPRGAPLVCPSIRVVLLNDPQRSHRVVRVEAFQRVEAGGSVADVFGLVASSMGPPIQTEMMPEQVRGGAVVVWRQRWREGMTEGPVTEIFVTQEAPMRGNFGLPDTREPATGVGTVVADPEAEGAFASVRRRLRMNTPR